MPVRTATSSGGVGASRSLTDLLREALKEENATPNTPEGGGMRDSVVAGCNHARRFGNEEKSHFSIMTFLTRCGTRAGSRPRQVRPRPKAPPKKKKIP